MAVKAKDRRMADARRRLAIQQSNLYARNLASLRRKEIGRLINLAKDTVDARNWAQFFDTNLSEIKYFPSWYKGLIMSCGKLSIRSTIASLAGAEAARGTDLGIFENRLLAFAEKEAGEKIATVSATLKDNIKAEIYKALDEDINIGVERMAVRLQEYAKDGMLWQARRIAQTESLIGLAEGAHEAADSLNVAYRKRWLCSGLQNTRDTHLAMDGVIVEQDEMFHFPDCDMLYAHDPQGTPAEIINCACTTDYIPKE